MGFFSTLRFLAGGTLALSAALLIIALIIRVIIGKAIAKRASLVLIAKGYDPDDMDLQSMGIWISLFLGVIIGFIAVQWYVSSFPTVVATNELYEDEEE